MYRAEIAAGVPALKNMSEQLSAELFRRREAGEYKEPEPVQPSPTFRDAERQMLASVDRAPTAAAP
ncbi:hypothetical protein [Devosia sp. LjRoot3]|uniref:hypothetical protein n=1 Tax=Devosia sp. LjRoot3 TaxID=3342319 RepID=UPI003ECD6292